MNTYVIAHFSVTALCIIVYLLYGVFDKSEITLFQAVFVLALALTPVLNIGFTLWCIIYLVNSLFEDLMNSISGVNKKAFGT